MTEYRDARTHAPGGPASPPRQGPVRVVGGSDFGTQTVGTTSTVRYFSVQDTGLVDLTVQRIELRGTDAASFTMLSRCGATLDVGARCNVRVSFAPQTAGAKAAKLAVVFALCEGSGAVTQNLRGTAVNQPLGRGYPEILTDRQCQWSLTEAPADGRLPSIGDARSQYIPRW